MNKKLCTRYAELLVDYCIKVQPNDVVIIKSSPLAQSLVLACQRMVMKRGGHCEFSIGLDQQRKNFFKYATPNHLNYCSERERFTMAHVNAVINIHAPYNVFELDSVNQQAIGQFQHANRPIKDLLMTRGSSGDLRWVICNYPTQSLADVAKMSLSDYSDFIANACFLNNENSVDQWGELSIIQARIVDRLNCGQTIRFKSPNIDMCFDIGGRIWINSDGKRNMPSGEVFTSPIEDSGNGWVHFTYPSMVFGQEIHGLRLKVKDGEIIEWTADAGQSAIEQCLAVEGATRFGEIAIGTNSNIQEATLNTLFDEKISGSIHMAIGASYPETGGCNQSAIHHDFITDMRDGVIILDDREIYKNGEFTPAFLAETHANQTSK